MSTDNQLAIIAHESGLQENKVEGLLKSFAAYFNEAKKITEEVKDIVVTDESQTDLVVKAREARLRLKSLRVHVEKVRVELKEQSLREGRAIDGVANLIKALVVPVEEHLEKQEKFIEIREMERLQKKYEERVIKLTPYVEDISLYTLKDMSDVAFEKLLEQCIAVDKAKKEAEAKAEADRIAEEKRQALFNSRRLELAPYSDFIDKTVNLLDMTEEAYQTLLGEAKKAKKARDDEQEKIRKENEELRKKQEAERIAHEKKIAEEKRIADEKIAAERKAREEAEAKLKAEKEAQEAKERLAKAAEEAAKREEEEKRRQALLAPDKEKLLKLAETIALIGMPAVESAKAKAITDEAAKRLLEVAAFINKGATEL